MLTNIIVLIFEVLYYSLFMKLTRGNGKYYRYLIAFSIITIIGLFINTRTLESYFLLVILMLLALKYIVDKKTSLYDMLIIIIMLFANVIVELPIYLICYKLLKLNHFVTTLIFQIVKILLVILLKNILYSMYVKLHKLWNNNNFYIRYIFSVLVYTYVIIISFLLINKVWR